jgi:endonuclease I
LATFVSQTFQPVQTLFSRIAAVLILFCGSAAQAQISNYYNPALNLSDQTLKTALHNIIDGHQTYPYSSGGTDVWDLLKLTDRDPNNSANIILIYTGRSENAAQEYNNGSGWNREHVWPQSRGGLGTGQGVGTDVHHLRPCDIAVNGQRGNLIFAACVTCTPVVSEGVTTGSFIDNTNNTFEPRDAVKGDIARMLFYMAVRYEGAGELDLELIETITSGQGSAPLMGRLSDLLAWNAADPVDAFETNRNQVIFNFQGNRNPFVDHPELAEHLWGQLMGESWPLTVSTTASAKEDRPRAYPNPTTGNLSISGNCPAEWISDLTGREVIRLRNGQKEVNLKALPSGIYFVHTARCSDGDATVLRVLKL